MKKKVSTQGSVLAIATYKPKKGQEGALMQLIEEEIPVLRELELVTNRGNYVAKAKDGTIIQVFEWVSTSAISAAHEHPAISNIWEKMTLIAEYPPLNSLSETQRPFPGFEIVR